MLLHQSHLHPSAVTPIVTYLEKGGRILIAGLTAVYNSKGQVNFSAIEALMDIPKGTSEKLEPFKESLTLDKNSPILDGLTQINFNDRNKYHAVAGDFEEQGYQVLAEGVNLAGENIPVLLKRDDRIVMFGDLGTLDPSFLDILTENIFAYLTRESTNDQQFQIAKTYRNLAKPCHEFYTII